MGLARLIFANDGECDLAGFEVLQPFAARDELAGWRKNGGNPDDVAGGDTRVAQRELEARQALAVLSDSLGEENVLRDERHEWCRSAVPPDVSIEKKLRSKISKRAQRCQLISRL